jgi:hypothetical protein
MILSRGIIIIAIIINIESRMVDRESKVLASNRSYRQGFSAAAGLRRGVVSRAGGEGSTAYDKAIRPNEGILGKD